MPQSKDEDRSESAEPDAMKVARPVLNGGDEETCPKGKCALSLPNPWSDGITGIRLSPLELLEKLAALVPLPRVHLVRYGGCLAPHSHLRGAIIPDPTSARHRRAGGSHRVASLELGASAQARLCGGY